MTFLNRIQTAALAACAALALSACVGGGAPNSQDTDVNDPSFSGVTDTTATDGSYSPDTGL